MASGLTLALNAAADGLKRGIQSASDAVGDLGGESKVSSKRVKLLAGALTAVASATSLAIKKAISYGDFLEKTSQKTGSAVETLSAYSLAAELAGTSQDGLIRGLQQLQRRIGEALRTPTSAAAIAFRDLGISITDASGELRSADDVLSAIGAKFSTMEDGTKKVALAMDLMGRVGAEMIPLLNGGADAMELVTAKSEVLGKLWSQETATAAAELNDSLTTLKAGFFGFFERAAQFYLPMLRDLAGGFEDLLLKMLGFENAKGNLGLDDLQIAQKQLGEVERKLADARQAENIAFIRGKAEEAGAAIELQAVLERQREGILLAIDDAGREAETMKTASADRQRLIEEEIELKSTAAARAKQLASAQAKAEREAASARLKAAQEDARERAAAERSVQTALERMESVQQRVMLARLDGAERIIASTAIETAQIDSQTADLLANEAVTGAERVRLREAATAAIIALESDAARQITAINRAAIEEETAARLAASQKIVDAEKKEATDRIAIQQSVSGAISQIASATAQLITTITSAVTAKQKKAARTAFIVRKAVAIGMAAINTALAIGNALATVQPFPAAVAAAIGAGVAGAVQTGAIIAQPMPAGIGDAGVMPGALAKAGLRNHSLFIKNDREMLLDPRGTSEVTAMLSETRRMMSGSLGGSGREIRIDAPIVLDGREVGRFVDNHMIQQEERGRDRRQRVRTRPMETV